MQQFEWPFGPDIPAAYDLRRLGWRRVESDGAARSAAFRPVLIDAATLPAAAWSRLFDPADLGRAFARVFLLGVADSGERARLMALGLGDAVGAGLSLAEVEARAARIALGRVPRTREVGGVRLDLVAREAFAGGRAIGLHPREFELLWRLADTPGVPVSREELLAEVWRLAHVPETNSLAVHVSRLRRKLAAMGLDGLVRTAEPGGYFLAADCPALPLPPVSAAEDGLILREPPPGASTSVREPGDGRRRDG